MLLLTTRNKTERFIIFEIEAQTHRERVKIHQDRVSEIAAQLRAKMYSHTSQKLFNALCVFLGTIRSLLFFPLNYVVFANAYMCVE